MKPILNSLNETQFCHEYILHNPKITIDNTSFFLKKSFCSVGFNILDDIRKLDGTFISVYALKSIITDNIFFLNMLV